MINSNIIKKSFILLGFAGSIINFYELYRKEWFLNSNKQIDLFCSGIFLGCFTGLLAQRLNN